MARLVLPGEPLADIGTDHAYLPAYLVAAGSIPAAIAGDILPGPLDAARTTVQTAGLDQAIALRLGPGLAPIAPGEAATVTICGMGGPLIAEILAQGPLDGVRRLVLQPMGGEERVRAWLAHNGWRLMAEELVEDGGRLYVILAAEPGAMALSEVEMAVGPFLRSAGGPLFCRYLQGQIDLALQALDGAQRSTRPEGRERADALRGRIRLLKEVLDHAEGRADHPLS